MTDMIRRIRERDNVSPLIQTEFVDVLQEASPECSWDANARLKELEFLQTPTTYRRNQMS